MKDMPKHIQIVKMPSISFYFGTHFKGAANFCVCAFKRLDRSAAMLFAVFTTHPSKICLAQNG